MTSVAKILLDLKAVSIDPSFAFTWASGIRSPIYCDNRVLLSYPKEREIIINGLQKLLKEHYPEVEVLAGTATAGIPHAAFLADRFNLPMVYVRSSSKEHGKKNTVEGHLKAGQKVVVIEDLISTGKSSLAAVNELKQIGAEVLGVISIFTYGSQKADEAFQTADLKYHSLENVDSLLEQVDLSDTDSKKVNEFIAAL